MSLNVEVTQVLLIIPLRSFHFSLLKLLINFKQLLEVLVLLSQLLETCLSGASISLVLAFVLLIMSIVLILNSLKLQRLLSADFLNQLTCEHLSHLSSILR